MNYRFVLGLMIGIGLLASPVMGGEAPALEEEPISEVSIGLEEVLEQVLTDELPQSISMEGIVNAHELGGYLAEDGRSVRHGVLLRTAKLSDATQNDLDRLENEFHLAKILDFRSDDEIEASPDQEIQGAENIHLPIISPESIDEYNNRIAELAQEGIDISDELVKIQTAAEVGLCGPEMYIRFLEGENGKAGYAQMFEELLSLEDDQALLFHCTYGKDRTGCAAMLILSALGVDEATIMEDFLLTNEYMADEIEAYRMELEQSDLDEAQISLVLSTKHSVEAVYMENLLDWIEENYGSPVEYIQQELGVTQEEIDQLKDKFLE